MKGAGRGGYNGYLFYKYLKQAHPELDVSLIEPWPSSHLPLSDWKKIGQAKYLFTTHQPFKVRGSQVNVAFWHGIPLKRVGTMANNTKRVDNQRNERLWHRTADLVTSSSDLYESLMSACMGIETHKYQKLGFPRIDALLAPKAKYDKNFLLSEFFHGSLEKDPEARIGIYLPTFRYERADQAVMDRIKQGNFLAFADFDLASLDQRVRGFILGPYADIVPGPQAKTQADLVDLLADLDCLVLVPLITVPYLSRVLGPATYGIYSSVNNTVQFLMIFCVLSLSNIGGRTISRARAKGQRQDLTAAFWGLWYFQFLGGLVMVAGTILVCVIFKVRYWFYFILMVPYLIAAQFDISWFFQGLADFGRVVLRNTIVKLVSVVFILLLVKSPGDLWKYFLIMSVSTMLGVITSISLVIMPQMAIQDRKTQKTVLKKSLEATVMLGTLFAAVVMVNTREFVPFFFGQKYVPMTPLMFWFTLTIILIPTGGVFANQFALANKRDKDYAIPVTIGAGLELVLSWLLDRPFGALGAMIAILTTELVVLFLRCWIVRDGYDFRYTFQEVPKCFAAMLICLALGLWWPLGRIGSALIDMVVKSLVVIAVYALCLYLFKFDLNEDVFRVLKRYRKKA